MTGDNNIEPNATPHKLFSSMPVLVSDMGPV